jgi:hypothetical protein
LGALNNKIITFHSRKSSLKAFYVASQSFDQTTADFIFFYTNSINTSGSPIPKLGQHNNFMPTRNKIVTQGRYNMRDAALIWKIELANKYEFHVAVSDKLALAGMPSEVHPKFGYEQASQLD